MANFAVQLDGRIANFTFGRFAVIQARHAAVDSTLVLTILDRARTPVVVINRIPVQGHVLFLDLGCGLQQRRIIQAHHDHLQLFLLVRISHGGEAGAVIVHRQLQRFLADFCQIFLRQLAGFLRRGVHGNRLVDASLITGLLPPALVRRTLAVAILCHLVLAVAVPRRQGGIFIAFP